MLEVHHRWRFDGEGGWECYSVMQDDDFPFIWRIHVCDDGTFDITDSDSELTDREETFDTLAEAKAFCRASDLASLALCQIEELTFRPKGQSCED